MNRAANKNTLGKREQIVGEIGTRQMAELEGRSQVAIIWRCRNGYYSLVRKVKSGAGGDRGERSWLIDINDPRISEATRTKYYLKGFIIKLAEDVAEKRFKALERNMLELSEKANQAKDFMNSLQGKF